MLEGVSCAGKTSVMYEIKKLFAADGNLERSIVMLSEHYTQVLNVIFGELRHHECGEHTDMLIERVRMLEGLHGWTCSLGSHSRRSRGLYTVFERGLLNHLAYYEDFDDPVVVGVGERFAAPGIETIVLALSENLFEKRSKLRCAQLNESKPEAYHRAFAEDAKRQQAALLAAAGRSGVPYRVICTDEMEWERYAREIVG